MKKPASNERPRPLRPGDLVEVRPASEILETLDDGGALDGVPFMPEMRQHLGRRFTVGRRVEKICDTVAQTGSRRMRDTVYLEDLRCDGSGHGGCQAGCRIYWKEAWLRRVEPDAAAVMSNVDAADDLAHLASAATRTVRELDGESADVWRCQATDAFHASEGLRVRQLGQYWRELRSGNVAFVRFVRVMSRAFVMEVAERLRLLSPVPLTGEGREDVPARELRPGDLVQVRSPAEIAATLDQDGLSRGLSFDREMLPYCGKTYRVKDRVQRIIDDKTGRMLQISRDCIVLEGVVCSGERSVGRWFCPREIYPYWRESWLRPVDADTAGT